MRWKGQGAKMTGNGFKFLWGGGCKAENSVGVIVANWLLGKVVRVDRFNDTVMKVDIVIEDVVYEVASCYCPLIHTSANEKEEFLELIATVVTSVKVFEGDNFNCHVGSDLGGFGEVHSGFRIGQTNDGGIRLLDWAVGKGLCLINTFHLPESEKPT